MLAGWARKISAETAAYPVPVYLGHLCFQNVHGGNRDIGRVERWRAHGRVRWRIHDFRREPPRSSATPAYPREPDGLTWPWSPMLRSIRQSRPRPRLANVLDKLPKGSTTEPRISALE